MRNLWRIFSGSVFGSLALGALLFSPLHTSGSAYADVDDFRYQSWHVDTHLRITDTGRAYADVTETLVASFPDHDENKGIVRALQLTYANADAAPENISVHDVSGAPVPFEIVDEDEFRIILVGDDEFVHGNQTYVLSYQIPDVIRPFGSASSGSNSVSEEWYWDIIPLERAQPIEAASATVSFSPELARELTGQHACYFGPAYDTAQCDLTVSDSEAGTLALAPFTLPGGSGITLAVGFHQNTVLQPDVRLPNAFLDSGPIISGIAALAFGAAGALIVWSAQRRRARNRTTTVAQYEVPVELPPILAAQIVKKNAAATSAQIVHLAANGFVRFEEAPGTDPIKSAPAVRLLSRDNVRDPLDAATLTALFGDAAVGAVLTIPKHSEAFVQKITDLNKKAATAAHERRYLYKERLRLPFIFGLTAVLLAVSTFVLLIAGSDRAHAATWLWSLPTSILGFLLALVGLLKSEFHTPAGAEAREYLLGVKEFIRVAEADRIRMLESVSGSERFDDHGTTVLRIYEKLTPYAVLFGQEKEWAQALETQYVAQDIVSPQWYPAIATLGIANLNRSLSHFTREFSSAASYTSSSTGGASGGGYSGGGGGGGFSGGR